MLRSGPASVFFVFSVVVWSIFALQDSILDGPPPGGVHPGGERGVRHRQARRGLLGGIADPLVHPGELGGAGGRPDRSGVDPALPAPGARHTALPVKVRPLDGWRAYLARDTAGLLFAQGLTVALPIVVLSRLGAEAAGAFAVVWMLSQTLDLLSINMGMSLTVEGVHDQDRLPAMLRQLRLRIVPLVCLVAAIGAATAPFFLTLFGRGYAASARRRWRSCCSARH